MDKGSGLTLAIIGGFAALALIGSADKPPKPENQDCKDWDWDKEKGVWVCDDTNSSNYRSYYHGGSYYRTSSDLDKDPSYSNYKNSANFAGKSRSSGFGSGSSYGG